MFHVADGRLCETLHTAFLMHAMYVKLLATTSFRSLFLDEGIALWSQTTAIKTDLQILYGKCDSTYIAHYKILISAGLSM